MYLAHGLEGYEQHGKCHPEYYGEYLGEFLTRNIAKRWLRDHGYQGAFAIVERVNGKIGRSWPYEIDAPEEDAGAEDLSLLDDVDLDDGDLLDPARVRDKIKIAKLEAEIKAASRNGSHGGLGEVTEVMKFVREVEREASAPQKSFVEQVREAKEIVDIVSPRRESNPAPAPPPVDPKVSALKIIAENPNMIEIAKDVFGLKRESDSDPWADAFNKLLDHPQLPQIAGAIFTPLAGGLGNLFTSIASLLAPRQPQAPTNPDQGAQQPTPTVQPTQQTQQPPQVAPAETPALPANDQQPQAQNEQGPAPSPQDEFLYSLIGACVQNTPIEQVRNFVNLSLVRHPELEDSLDQLLNLPTDQLLALAVSIHPPLSQAQHARTWLESLINTLTAEGGEEFEKELET